MTRPTITAPPRHAPLSMDAATFRELGYRLVNQVAELLEGYREVP